MPGLEIRLQTQAVIGGVLRQPGVRIGSVTVADGIDTDFVCNALANGVAAIVVDEPAAEEPTHYTSGLDEDDE